MRALALLLALLTLGGCLKPTWRSEGMLEVMNSPFYGAIVDYLEYRPLSGGACEAESDAIGYWYERSPGMPRTLWRDTTPVCLVWQPRPFRTRSRHGRWGQASPGHGRSWHEYQL